MSFLVSTYNRWALPHIGPRHVQFFALLAAVAVYALFGSPTPDDPGIAEIAVGGLLVLAVGVNGVWKPTGKPFALPLWRSAGAVLLLYGLAVPFFIGVLNGAGDIAILRDVLPFLFFLLPVFLFAPIQRWNGNVKILQMVVIGAGVVFAARSIAGTFMGFDRELFYFANAPTVLFGALILIATIGRCLSQMRILTAVLCGVFVMVPLFAMALNVQRASLGAVALFTGLIAAGAFVKSPVKALVPLLVLGFAACFIMPTIQEIWSLLFQKTTEVGVNMRAQEAVAVWQAVAENPMTFLFGLGWGAEFYSPAVGGLSVGFTHNLFTYFFLKMGLVGMVLAGLYLAGLADWLYRLFYYDRVLALALVAPFLINLTLYASFKSLDFGLILLLIPAFVFYKRNAKASALS